MANKSFRKSQLIAFDNAAAGHEGVLSDRSGAMIVKPCQQSEIDFYESTKAHPDFLPFVPEYMGRLSLGSEPAQAAGALVPLGETTPDDVVQPSTATLPVVEHAWKPSGGGKIQTDLAIVLENIAAGFKKPNILDVKLGARLWADDCPLEKRERLNKVAAETTSKPLGFRIAGMKTYHGMDGVRTEDITTDGYKVFDKNYGRIFNERTICQGFQEFFLLKNDIAPTAPIKKIIKRFIRDLQQLAEVMEKEESRMYSASLLFVYEGDPKALDSAFIKEAGMITSAKDRQQDAIENSKDIISPPSSQPEEEDGDSSDDDQPKFPAIWNVKLIDFAHAQWVPGQGPDENLLHGVSNVIRVLHDLIG